MRNAQIVALTLILASCSSAPVGRHNPDSVRAVSTDVFKKQHYIETTACITEGFKRIPQSVWHNHITTQQVIPNGYRIEVNGALGGTLMLSANGTYFRH